MQALHLLAIFAFQHLAHGYKKYVFEVSLQYKSPDCVEKPVTLINGQFPGPLINVSAGELLEVEVRYLFFSTRCYRVTLLHNSMVICQSTFIAVQSLFRNFTGRYFQGSCKNPVRMVDIRLFNSISHALIKPCCIQITSPLTLYHRR